MLPLVSVIIPTYNSEGTLDLCLQSIINQSYKKIEIVVVDGGSVDDTLKISQKYGVKVVRTEKPSRTLQRNVGLVNASGKILLNVDSDEVLPCKLIQECVSRILHRRCEAIFVPTIDTGFSYLGKSRCLGNYINIMLRKEAYVPNSALRCFTRKVFEIVGGMDDDLLVGEDVVFAIKCLKYKFRMDRCKLAILHYATEGLQNILMKKYVYGKTYKRYKKKYRKLCSCHPNKKDVETGLFYLKNIFKFNRMARYIPGFLIVKLIERLGLILGSGIKEYFF